MRTKVLEIVNSIREKKGLEPVAELTEGMSLRDDLGMDSFELAELTVHIEDEFGVDIFEDEIIYSVDELLKKISNAE